jgi:hypothetical protein
MQRAYWLQMPRSGGEGGSKDTDSDSYSPGTEFEFLIRNRKSWLMGVVDIFSSPIGQFWNSSFNYVIIVSQQIIIIIIIIMDLQSIIVPCLLFHFHNHSR